LGHLANFKNFFENYLTPGNFGSYLEYGKQTSFPHSTGATVNIEAILSPEEINALGQKLETLETLSSLLCETFQSTFCS